MRVWIYASEMIEVCMYKLLIWTNDFNKTWKPLLTSKILSLLFTITCLLAEGEEGIYSLSGILIVIVERRNYPRSLDSLV